jgi:hypothetical protein
LKPPQHPRAAYSIARHENVLQILAETRKSGMAVQLTLQKSRTRAKFLIRLIALAATFACVESALSGNEPDLPLRIAFVKPAEQQPTQSDPAVIFYDDFTAPPEVNRSRYFEYGSADGSFVWSSDSGMDGGAMRCQFAQGQVTAGNLKVLFGKNPFRRGVRHDETFEEIYWRVYVKHEAGWEGNPAKLARATCLATEDWTQGMIAHVWGGKGDVLCIDPATGIRDNVKITTRYNDFDRLTWLGSRNGQTPIFSAAESGRWVCVESHVKLNHPGSADGVFELWVDGHLEAARTNLNWRGTWSQFAINAVFLENYWNQGSAKRQARWFDNFVISARPIGPIFSSPTPVITRTTVNARSPWEVELAIDSENQNIVWRSRPMSANATALTIDREHGEFLGSRPNKNNLATGLTYCLRIRRVGEAAWSPWHAPFRL